MRIAAFARAALAASFAIFLPSLASAQLYESVGIRAQGMAGAFVAVADDASATWWNPAGLATGALFSTVIDRSFVEEQANESPDAARWRSRATGFAAAYPAFGVSLYRLRVSEIAETTTTDGSSPDREEGEPGVPARSVAVNQYGVTFGQSIGDHLVIATTLKLVRGGFVQSTAEEVGTLGGAERLDVRLHTSADLDAGAMARFGAFRVGVGIRNMREPKFGAGSQRLQLHRQVRVGGAFINESRTLTASADADITTTRTPLGNAKHMAAGLEGWLWQRTVGLRTGVSTNTAGQRATSASVGASLLLTRGLYLEGALTRGTDHSVDGWAAGIGMTY